MISERIQAVMICIMFFFGCAERKPPPSNSLSLYWDQLEKTKSNDASTSNPEILEKAFLQFKDFYKVYSKDIIERDLRKLYAQNAYFRDPFNEVEGIDAIEKHFLASADTIDSCVFDIEEPVMSGHDVYCRWIMHLQLKRDKTKEITQTLGMSHVRFSNAGEIVFHVDYWDPSIAVYEKIPVLKRLVQFVRKRVSN
ncbi:nuclear transport factor 2 family protein [bacterium]|nr:nuclear transport factor 2 family protein [candidate division CSSED10-310 bacterium]